MIKRGRSSCVITLAKMKNSSQKKEREKCVITLRKKKSYSKKEDNKRKKSKA